MKKLLFLTLWVFVGIPVFSREVDSIITLKNSPFFTDLIKRSAPIPPLSSSPFKLIDFKEYTLKEKAYQIFKISSTLFIHFTGSGLLYQLQNPTDTILAFKRIDDTEDYNYNIMAFLFTNKKDIYNIGGYGFWKSNGTLRKYNTEDKEWDADPVNDEIHIPFARNLCWFNFSTEKLFIPFQQITNTGLKIENDVEPLEKRVYQLDLKKKTWKKLGKTHPDFFEIISKFNWHIPTERGHILIYNNKVYDIDYEENQINEYENASYVQTLDRINDNYVKYFYQGTMYYLDGRTGRYDSLKIPLENFKKADFRVWKKNNTGFAFGVAPIVVILAAVAAKKRRTKEAREKILTSVSTGTPIVTPIKIKFSETEKQLLDLLLNKSKNNSTTTITEINYVLGIKDKNLGLQKKVRSEVMKSINEKFDFLQDGDTELVCNIRSQADKRFFEYYIDKANITLLEIMLKAEA